MSGFTAGTIQRFAAVAALLCFGIRALPQSTDLVPLWVTGTWPHCEVSNDGSTILSSTSDNGGFAFGIYATSDESCLAHVELLLPTSANPRISADGKTVYYSYFNASSQYVICKYDVASRKPTFLSVHESNPISGLAPSHDGKTLAYVLQTNPNTVVLYNLANGQKKRFPLQGTVPKTSGIDFVDGDARLVCSGVVIYDLNGNIIYRGWSPYHASTDGHTIAISPDEGTIFALDGNNVAAFSATGTPSQLWSTSSPLPTTDTIGSSGDGMAALLSGADQWIPLGATTGQALSSPVDDEYATDLAPPVSEAVCGIPGSTELLFGLSTSPRAERFNFDPTTGSHPFEDMFMDGGFQNYQTTQYPIFRSGLDSPSGLALVTTEDILGSGTYVRDAATGRYLYFHQRSGVPSSFVEPSPDGKYSVRPDPTNGQINVYTFPGGVFVSSSPLAIGLAQSNWSDQKDIWVTDGSSVCLYQFNNGLNLAYTFPPGSGSVKTDGVVTTPDGDRLAISDDSGVTRIFDLTSFTQVGQINSAGTLQAAAGDRIGIHYNTATANIEEVYKISSNPQLLKRIQYNVGAAGWPCVGALSPDGSLVALLHSSTVVNPNDPRVQGSIRIYNVSNGSVVRKWDNQFILQEPAVSLFSPDGSMVVWAPSYNQWRNELGGWMVAAHVPPIMTTLSVSSRSVVGGNSVTGLVTLNRPAEMPVTVNLTSSNSAAQVPSSIVVAAGASQGTFTITTNQVQAAVTITITTTEANSGRLATRLKVIP